jgi:phage FluMu gp28-like protein
MMAELQRSPLKLYPYQRRWLSDPAKRKLARKSRRIGFSFAEGLDGVLSCHEREKHKFIVLSRSDRLSKEFITDSVVPHCKAIGIIADYAEGTLPGTSFAQSEITFTNGSRIIALPANPDTARSYEGDILLDEFAFHKGARKIAEAIIPAITRGFKLKIISTPNGQQGPYYDLSKECGLVDGIKTSSRFSAHSVDIYEAIAEGCLDKDGHVLDSEEIRASCLDEEMWLQEYCCQFLSTAAQWISPELFQACVSDDAVMGFPNLDLRNLYAGWDIARNKDLSVIWFLELVGDVTVTRGVVEYKNVPTPDQQRDASAMMQLCQRMAIDKSGMGISIFESLEERWGGQVEGVTFTQQAKELMAVHAKRRMEATATRLPDDDVVRNSFRSVKKTVTATGMARFDAEHDEKYGHADHWWAYCLAEQAAGAPLMLGVVEYFKQATAEEQVKRQLLQKPTTNEKTEKCPKCECRAVQRVAGRFRCAQCGEMWGKVGSASPFSRKDLDLQK